MANKLGLYNGSISALGDRTLAALTENRPSRRRLDAVWDGGWVKYCLEQGNWNFAMRDMKLSFNPSVEPQYGFSFAFDKPSDWCRTFMMSADEAYSMPLLDREDQGGFWFANVPNIYARLVSSDASFGGDLSLWTQNFTVYAEHYGAWKIAPAQTGSLRSKAELDPLVTKLLKTARATDALDETTRFPAPGSWSRARQGARATGQRGNPNKLYG